MDVCCWFIQRNNYQYNLADLERNRMISSGSLNEEEFKEMGQNKTVEQKN
jgi:hypothetical protein